MPRTVTILSPKAGRRLDSTLEEALKTLHSNGVLVDAAAHNIDDEGRPTVTILLQYVDDEPRALRILANSGIDVK
jgi:hypothetical protein